MSKKRRKKSQPVQMKRKESNTIATISGLDIARANKPYQVVSFKTGAHMSQKDRPRDNNWRKWDLD